jgi:tetratricopeptide (TPR) repeat protein
MFLPVASRWLFAIALSAVAGGSVWAQHGGHGGGHHSGGHGFGHHYGGHGYGGHGFGGYAHAFGHGFSHHYHPSYYGGYYGLGYGAYGYNSWPYSYTPRAYSYSGTSTAYVAPPSESAYRSDATNYQRAAESAFRSHHYDDAIEWAKRAAKEMPRDGRLFLLLSQAHFAVGEYRDAAGAARLGMSLLPAEDWGFVVENFRSYYHDSDYVAQVRRLRQFIAENPSHADARFLLGYHWLFLGHSEAAKREAYFAAAFRELSQALELNPSDESANRLLEMVGGAQPDLSPSVSGSRPTSESPAASQSPRSVDASVEYPPPQEFEKPRKSGGGEAVHPHNHKE